MFAADQHGIEIVLMPPFKEINEGKQYSPLHSLHYSALNMILW